MTVANLQEIGRINKTTPDNIEQIGYIICELYGLTVAEVNAMEGKAVLKFIDVITKRIEAKPKWYTRLIRLQTDANKITFGQLAECQTWLKESDSLQAMDLVAASLLLKRTEHATDAARIKRTPFIKVRMQVEAFINSMNSLLQQYKGLFEINEDEQEERADENEHPFIKQYSWHLSAGELAKHEGITFEQAFDLPVLQALNGMAYLKSKAAFEKWKSKK